MIRILATVFAALFGLAFGSFLNVCLSRWPRGESVVKPASHCRTCARTLTWWENVPLLSWLALRGRCRGCGRAISWRYPLVETAIGALWAVSVWQAMVDWPDFRIISPGFTARSLIPFVILVAGKMLLCWLLVALAVLDLENFWLPDWLTLPGTAVGYISAILHTGLLLMWSSPASRPMRHDLVLAERHSLYVFIIKWTFGVVVAAGLVLLIRWAYWIVRRKEGVGLGDAKLLALLAAWLGLPGALLAFGLGVVMGAVAGLALLAVPVSKRGNDSWASTRLPLGTFLCIGGIVSSLWGPSILQAYMRWAGFY
jgi:leader peptidase (prepilin peptidase)/N-methyltransferase